MSILGMAIPFAALGQPEVTNRDILSKLLGGGLTGSPSLPEGPTVRTPMLPGGRVLSNMPNQSLYSLLQSRLFDPSFGGFGPEFNPVEFTRAWQAMGRPTSLIEVVRGLLGGPAGFMGGPWGFTGPMMGGPQFPSPWGSPPGDMSLPSAWGPPPGGQPPMPPSWQPPMPPVPPMPRPERIDIRG